MRFAAIFALSGCALFAVCLVGCTALLDTDSLSNGHGASGVGGGGGANGGADAAAGAGGSAGSLPAAAGSNAQGGSAGSGDGGNAGNAASGGNADIGGGGSTGMAGASAGAGGGPCIKSGKEVCDGVDNDCNPATPDCPTGCTPFTVNSVSYMACDKLASWDSAELACIGQSMLLAQISSTAENEAITTKLQALKLSAQVWIGGESDPNNDNTFKWVSGVVIYKDGKAVANVYQNFASDQPASLSGPSRLQISTSNDASAGTWSNALPTVSQAFVCQTLTL
jgi:hypothetical protein